MTGRNQSNTGTIHSALRLPCRAPSVHSTQRWRWRMGQGPLHLVADRSRALPVTAPQGRNLLISCGAVPHRARTASTAALWRIRITRLPVRAGGNIGLHQGIQLPAQIRRYPHGVRWPRVVAS